MGAMLSGLCNIAFCTIFGLHTAWATAAMKLISFLPMSKKSHEEWSLYLTRLAWSIAFMCCPWIRIQRAQDGWDEYEALVHKVHEADAEVAAGKAKHKPLFTFGNHTSFVDVPLCVIKLPYFAYIRGRTYMADHLYKLPLLGYICKAVGHFPVYFSSDLEGVFKVDAEKMAVVEANVDKFMDDGGFLSIYPEGQINKKSPDTILPFRFGGIKRALERDARIALLVFYGNPKVWPAKALVSGKPGKIVYGGKVIAPDGCQSYVKGLRDAGLEEDEKDLADHALLAKRLRTITQEMYDSYKAIALGTSSKKDD